MKTNTKLFKMTMILSSLGLLIFSIILMPIFAYLIMLISKNTVIGYVVADLSFAILAAMPIVLNMRNKKKVLISIGIIMLYAVIIIGPYISWY